MEVSFYKYEFGLFFFSGSFCESSTTEHTVMYSLASLQGKASSMVAVALAPNPEWTVSNTVFYFSLGTILAAVSATSSFSLKREHERNEEDGYIALVFFTSSLDLVLFLSRFLTHVQLQETRLYTSLP